MSETEINNIGDVRKELAILYANQKSGFTNHAAAKEMNNTMGKMIAASKVELEHCVARKEKPEIEFLKSSN